MANLDLTCNAGRFMRYLQYVDSFAKEEREGYRRGAMLLSFVQWYEIYLHAIYPRYVPFEVVKGFVWNE